MKLKPYIDKLEQSSKYKEFNSKYPESFPIAGFFILDFESGKNMHQIDFYVPSQKKIAAFTLDGKVDLQLLEMLNKKVPEKLDIKSNIDLEAIKGILMDEMHNRGFSEDIKKIIVILQQIDGKKIWNAHCVLTGMEIVKSHIDDETKTILRIEKISIMDLIKKMPMQQIPMQQINPEKKEDIKKEIEGLNKLAEQIENEKKRLKNAMEKKNIIKNEVKKIADKKNAQPIRRTQKR